MWGRAEWLGKDENEMEQRQEKGNDISWTKLRQEEITQIGKQPKKCMTCKVNSIKVFIEGYFSAHKLET